MRVAAFASVKGSPGVTTAVCALAAGWPADRAVMIVELDPAGGDIAGRFELSPTRGLISVAASGRHGLSRIDVLDHLQHLPGGVPVFVGAQSAEQFAVVEPVWPTLRSSLADLDTTVLLDCGRLGSAQRPNGAFATADLRVLVGRPTVEGTSHIRRAGMPADGVLLIGERPYTPAEVGEALGLAVIGALAEDRRAARMLSGEPGSAGRFAASLLMRSARPIADSLSHDLANRPDVAERRGAG